MAVTLERGNQAYSGGIFSACCLIALAIWLKRLLQSSQTSPRPGLPAFRPAMRVIAPVLRQALNRCQIFVLVFASLTLYILVVDLLAHLIAGLLVDLIGVLLRLFLDKNGSVLVATNLTRDRPDRFYKPVRSNSNILYWLQWVADRITTNGLILNCPTLRG